MKITDWLAMRHIKKMSGTVRDRKFAKFVDAAGIGIVFDATDSEDFEKIKGFIRDLKTLSRKVQAVGFVDNKVTPSYLYPKSDIDLFNRKELIWGFKPASPYIQTFLKEKWGLLIDVNMRERVPLFYLSAASAATCKIGRLTDFNLLDHEILISLRPEEGLDFYLKQVMRYMT